MRGMGRRAAVHREAGNGGRVPSAIKAHQIPKESKGGSGPNIIHLQQKPSAAPPTPAPSRLLAGRREAGPKGGRATPPLWSAAPARGGGKARAELKTAAGP